MTTRFSLRCVVRLVACCAISIFGACRCDDAAQRVKNGQTPAEAPPPDVRPAQRASADPSPEEFARLITSLNDCDIDIGPRLVSSAGATIHARYEFNAANHEIAVELVARYASGQTPADPADRVKAYLVPYQATTFDLMHATPTTFTVRWTDLFAYRSARVTLPDGTPRSVTPDIFDWSSSRELHAPFLANLGPKATGIRCSWKGSIVTLGVREP